MRPFQGCWDRIERASAHRHALAETWNSFIAHDIYHTRVEMNRDETGAIWVSPVANSIPASFSLQLGEMLYQLRAALDGAVYAAAIQDSGQYPPVNEKYLEFPIYSLRDGFHSSLRKIGPLSQKRRSFIEAVQPYNTPDIATVYLVGNFNKTLAILNDWARIDRHRQLHIVWSWIAEANPLLHVPEGVTATNLRFVASGSLKNESKVATFTLDGFLPGMKLQANPNFLSEIEISESPPRAAENDTFSNRTISMIKCVKFITTNIESLQVWVC